MPTANEIRAMCYDFRVGVDRETPSAGHVAMPSSSARNALSAQEIGDLPEMPRVPRGMGPAEAMAKFVPRIAAIVATGAPLPRPAIGALSSLAELIEQSTTNGTLVATAFGISTLNSVAAHIAAQHQQHALEIAALRSEIEQLQLRTKEKR